MSKEISDKAIQDIQKISLKCYGWAISRDQAIDMWCIIAYNKPLNVVSMAARKIQLSTFKQLIQGCKELGVAR